MNPYLLTALIILGVLALFFTSTFIFTLFFCKQSFSRPKDKPLTEVKDFNGFLDEILEDVKWFENKNPERVVIDSFDGLKLCAYLVTHPNPKGSIVLLHGFHGRAKYDFSLVLKFFYDKGLNLLVPYQRTHGESEGKYLTFGTKESKDCLFWAKYLANRFKGLPIDLHGLSMGGATVMMTARFEDLPKEVKGITSDCGFTSPDEIIANVRKLMHLPKFPFQSYARFFAKKFAKFDMKEVNTIDILSKNKLPILFIHGGNDTFVPTEMSVRNYNASASENKKLLIIEGAGHGHAYIKDRKAVENALSEFIEKHII